MNVKVEIDAGACVGYGECLAAEPEAVELDGDGVARLLVATLPHERAERLCAACPSAAITMDG
jgi:ferredoxin